MSQLLRNLWNWSPREICQRLHRKFVPGSKYQLPVPEWVTVKSGPIAGAQLFIAPAASDTWQKMADGTLDAAFLDRVGAIRPLEGCTVWDVGAHVGFHSLTLAGLVGAGGRVVSFEPNRFNRERYSQHLARNPALASRIELKPFAFADRAGELTFVVSESIESGESSGSHLTTAQTPGTHYERFHPEKVEAVRADDLVWERGMKAPDMIKIDVEGAESLVLRGATRLLREVRPLLLIEVHHILEMFDVQGLLRDAGYTIEILDRAEASASRCFILARPV